MQILFQNACNGQEYEHLMNAIDLCDILKKTHEEVDDPDSFHFNKMAMRKLIN